MRLNSLIKGFNTFYKCIKALFPFSKLLFIRSHQWLVRKKILKITQKISQNPNNHSTKSIYPSPTEIKLSLHHNSYIKHWICINIAAVLFNDDHNRHRKVCPFSILSLLLLLLLLFFFFLMQQTTCFVFFFCFEFTITNPARWRTLQVSLTTKCRQLFCKSINLKCFLGLCIRILLIAHTIYSTYLRRSCTVHY